MNWAIYNTVYTKARNNGQTPVTNPYFKSSVDTYCNNIIILSSDVL